MHSLLQDLRFGCRVLARHRGFTATSILVLALGIGINAGIFTLINSLLLRPACPRAHPARLSACTARSGRRGAAPGFLLSEFRGPARRARALHPSGGTQPVDGRRH